MAAAVAAAARRPRILLITFDAFDTLYSPTIPIALQYHKCGMEHEVPVPEESELVMRAFKNAFTAEKRLHPNYGRMDGMTSQKWWHNVVVKSFQPFLQRGQTVPQSLVEDLYERFSGKSAYTLNSDVLPFLQRLKTLKLDDQWKAKKSSKRPFKIWPYTHTIVGVVSNSDNRIGSILKSLDVPVRSSHNETSSSSSSPSSSPSSSSSPPVPSATTAINDGPSVRLKDTTAQDDKALIDFIISSYDAGTEKPQKGIWDKAFEEAKTLSSKVASSENADWTRIHVGDHIRLDAYGAKDAGWRALWLRRDIAMRGPKVVRQERNIMRQKDAARQAEKGFNIDIVVSLDHIFKYLTFVS